MDSFEPQKCGHIAWFYHIAQWPTTIILSMPRDKFPFHDGKNTILGVGYYKQVSNMKYWGEGTSDNHALGDERIPEWKNQYHKVTCHISICFISSLLLPTCTKSINYLICIIYLFIWIICISHLPFLSTRVNDFWQHERDTRSLVDNFYQARLVPPHIAFPTFQHIERFLLHIKCELRMNEPQLWFGSSRLHLKREQLQPKLTRSGSECAALKKNNTYLQDNHDDVDTNILNEQAPGTKLTWTLYIS